MTVAQELFWYPKGESGIVGAHFMTLPPGVQNTYMIRRIKSGDCCSLEFQPTGSPKSGQNAKCSRRAFVFRNTSHTRRDLGHSGGSELCQKPTNERGTRYHPAAAVRQP